MPWQEATAMSLRQEFVHLAAQEGANIRQLCRRYGISPPTAYKWLARVRDGDATLADHSRRPTTSPHRTPPAQEAAVLAVRDTHPAWGARKLRARLLALGHPPARVPAASTIHALLRRSGRVDPAHPGAHTPWQRFEHPVPNALWQLDFKGHVPLVTGGRCHPLTVLDDHSRFALGLVACADEQAATVQTHLTMLFGRYGLPARILGDNGPPWGDDGDQPYTALSVWLLRLGIGVSHGRPRHPQTQGKDERFHRSLRAEVLAAPAPPLHDLAHAQARFDAWRDCYNLERPHQALGYATPASRYQPSPRPWPADLPPLTYGPEVLVRRVSAPGRISIHGRQARIGRAFVGQPVGLRPTTQERCYAVYFGPHVLGRLDLAQPADHPHQVLAMSPNTC